MGRHRARAATEKRSMNQEIIRPLEVNLLEERTHLIDRRRTLAVTQEALSAPRSGRCKPSGTTPAGDAEPVPGLPIPWLPDERDLPRSDRPRADQAVSGRPGSPSFLSSPKSRRMFGK